MMKAKPKPKKKPFRITKPGLYRTRDGRKAFVSSVNHEGFSYPVTALIQGEVYIRTYKELGHHFGGVDNLADLISRWPGKKGRRK